MIQDYTVIVICIFSLSFDSLGQTVVFAFVQLQLRRTKIRKREWKIVLFLNSTTEIPLFQKWDGSKVISPLFLLPPTADHIPTKLLHYGIGRLNFCLEKKDTRQLSMSGAVGKSLVQKYGKHKNKPKINLKCLCQSILIATVMELCKTVLQLHPGWTFYKKANISSKSRTCSAGTYKVTCNHCHIVGTSNCQVSLLVLESKIVHRECLQVLGYRPGWDVRGFEGHMKPSDFRSDMEKGFLESILWSWQCTVEE